MRILDRYLLHELLVPLGYCLCGFLMFWIAFDVILNLREFQNDGLQVSDVAEYYLVQTPGILVVILPVALLLALLYSLTNHARHNELTAIRGAGISLWRLCLPYLGVGLFISLASLALNEFFVPDSAETARRILKCRLPPEPGAPKADEVRDLVFRNEGAGRTWRIRLYKTSTGEMAGPIVTWARADGSRIEVRADRAVRIDGTWIMYGALAWEYPADPKLLAAPLPLQTNVVAFPEFTETPEQIRSEIKISNSIFVGGSSKTKKADMSVAEILNYLRLHPNPKGFNKAWLYTKLDGRLAAPWTCLVVVLMAVPFGAGTGKRNVFVGVASSILICFTFFVLQQVCLAFGSGGYLPPWLAAWSPNLSFGLVGLILTARVR
jgi:lipopolysaccharide export system permease protein